MPAEVPRCLRCLWLACGLALLAGCQLLGRPQAELPLLVPSALGQDWQVSQRLTVALPGGRQTLLVVWSQQGGQLNLVGLSPEGQVLFELGYDGARLREVSRVPLPVQLDARRLLQELQWAYWPAAAIDAQLAGSGWRLRESPGRRQLLAGGRARLSYEFASGEPPTSLVLTHRDGYRLDIETLVVQPLDTLKQERP